MVSFFALDRDVDASGVSGTGRVASGATLDTGTLLSWHAVTRTLGWYHTCQQVDDVHGHAGATRLTALTEESERSVAGTLITGLLGRAAITLDEALNRFAGGEVSAYGMDRDTAVIPGGPTGRLAVVVDLGSGSLVYWNAEDTIGWYPDLQAVDRIHGHNGSTRLTKLTDPDQRHAATASVPKAAELMRATIIEAYDALPQLTL